MDYTTWTTVYRCPDCNRSLVSVPSQLIDANTTKLLVDHAKRMDERCADCMARRWQKEHAVLT
jgi:uncharacterized protein with PIN domain